MKAANITPAISRKLCDSISFVDLYFADCERPIVDDLISETALSRRCDEAEENRAFLISGDLSNPAVLITAPYDIGSLISCMTQNSILYYFPKFLRAGVMDLICNGDDEILGFMVDMLRVPENSCQVVEHKRERDNHLAMEIFGRFINIFSLEQRRAIAELLNLIASLQLYGLSERASDAIKGYWRIHLPAASEKQ